MRRQRVVDRQFGVANFEAYFDDSGHPSQSVVLVAGFISTKEKWKKFEDEWNRVLKDAGLAHLHMTDFENSKKWTSLKKQSLRRRFRNAITRWTLFHISHTVPMPEYRKINDQYAFEEYQGGPYALAARTVAKSINDWKRKNMKSQDRLEVLFEAERKFKRG
jgi:hypothetical protein